MAFDPPRHHHGAHLVPDPMQIANSPFLTVRERLEILDELKLDVTGARANGDETGFTDEELDAAIEELYEQMTGEPASHPKVSWDH